MSHVNLIDHGAERAVLSGILKHGSDLLLDIENILDTSDFDYKLNQKIFSILKYMVYEKNCTKFELATILVIAKEIGYEKFIDGKEKSDYLEMLFISSHSESNTINMAIFLSKLSLARQGFSCLTETASQIAGITGKESIDELISIIEDPIFDFTGKITCHENTLQQIGSNFVETMQAVSENPQDIVGLPTGFSRWDYIIGGGLRRCTVNVVGARPKVGKSFFCLNVARNIASQNIPVLYLDTELTCELQMNRLVSLISQVELEHIETGAFAKIESEKEAVWKIQKEIQTLPITHCSVAGQSSQSIMSMARRWLAKTVKFNDHGKTQPCLIIYDYIKLMDFKDLSSRLHEHQMLGYLMTQLHNFALQWSLPVLATVQLNRGGVKDEGGEFASGSDRILWLTSNFTILKNKSTDELIKDPHKNGTKKLVVTDTRFGPGMESGQYINIYDKLTYGTFEEGKTSTELQQQGPVFNEKI